MIWGGGRLVGVGVWMVLEWRWELENMVKVGLVRERGFYRGGGDWKRGVGVRERPGGGGGDEACFLSGWRWRLDAWLYSMGFVALEKGSYKE